jgi:hypothetical protein
MDTPDLTDYEWAAQAVERLLLRVLALCASEFEPRAWGLAP